MWQPDIKRRLPMRILTLNLQNGGGSRIRRIVEALESKQADVIVLSEFRHNAGSLELRARLRGMGYGIGNATSQGR